MKLVCIDRDGVNYRYRRYDNKVLTDEIHSDKPLDPTLVEAVRTSPEEVCPRESA